MDDNIPSLDDLLKSIQEEDDDNIPGLDDLLESIKNEDAPQSSSALAVVPKKPEDLVEEDIDPQILSILGLEEVFDLTYEEYASLLKEASVKARMPGSQMSTESTELITDEFKRVKNKTGRFKVKPKKVDINKVLDRKQPTPPGAIVKTEKLIPTAPEVSPEQEKPAVDTENLQGDLVDGIGNILESLITIRTLMQNQSKGEQKIAEEEAKKTNKQKKKERESTLEKKKPQSPIVKAVAKPVIGFFDAIKKFFTNVVLGSVVLGLFKWLKDPKNKKAIDDFTNFLENNAGLILGGLLAIATLPIVPTLLSLTGAITGIAIPALKAAFAFLSTPAGLAALLFTAPKLAEKVDPKSFDVITREVILKATKEKLSKEQLITRIKDERSKIGPMDTFMGKGVFYDNLLKRLESGELDSLILETQKEYEEKGEISPSLLEKFTRGTGGLLSDIFSGAGKDIGNLVTKGKVQDTLERQRIRSRLNKIDFLNIFPDDEKSKSSVKPKTPLMPGPSPSAAQPETESASNRDGSGVVKVVPASHPETGSGYTVEGQIDQSGRPVVFSNPAAQQFAKAVEDSGMNLGQYIASSGRSEAKNASLKGADPNSPHMYGEAIDMNGAGYEWMKANGSKYGWKYVYNHGAGSAHFKYVGPGAGSTPKLSPPGSAPAPPSAKITRTTAPTPSISSPTGRGNIVPLPIPTGGGAQQASSGTASNQAPVPSFSSVDPNNATTMVVRAIYNIVG